MRASTSDGGIEIAFVAGRRGRAPGTRAPGPVAAEGLQPVATKAAATTALCVDRIAGRFNAGMLNADCTAREVVGNAGDVGVAPSEHLALRHGSRRAGTATVGNRLQ